MVGVTHLIFGEREVPQKWHTKHIKQVCCASTAMKLTCENSTLQIVIHIILCYVKKHFFSSVLNLCPISLTEWHLNLVFWEMEQNVVFYIFSMPCKSPCFKLESPKHFIFQIWWSELYIIFLIKTSHFLLKFAILTVIFLMISAWMLAFSQLSHTEFTFYKNWTIHYDPWSFSCLTKIISYHQ